MSIWAGCSPQAGASANRWEQVVEQDLHSSEAWQGGAWMRDNSWDISGEGATRQAGLWDRLNKQPGTPRDVSSWGSFVLWMGE